MHQPHDQGARIRRGPTTGCDVAMAPAASPVDRGTDLAVADDDRWDSVRLLHTATLAAVAVNGLHVDWRLRTYPAANGELRFRVRLAVRACLNWVGAYNGPWLWP